MMSAICRACHRIRGFRGCGGRKSTLWTLCGELRYERRNTIPCITAGRPSGHCWVACAGSAGHFSGGFRRKHSTQTSISGEHWLLVPLTGGARVGRLLRSVVQDNSDNVPRLPSRIEILPINHRLLNRLTASGT